MRTGATRHVGATSDDPGSTGGPAGSSDRPRGTIERSPAQPPLVLVLCSANQCRSVLAVAALQDALGGRPVARFRSAGTRAANGAPPLPGALCVARELGVDIAAHRSRRVELEELLEAELVLGMTRAHVREAVAAAPRCFDIAFTLKEASRRASAVGSRGEAEPLATWAARLGEGRARRDLMGQRGPDDIEDPAGRRGAAVEDSARQIFAAARSFAALAWPEPTRQGGPTARS